MIVQLSLSPLTIQNLYRIRGNPSSSIEWLVRRYYIYGFPVPHIVNNKRPKQIIDVQISPYVIGLLKGFASYGMTSSQAVEWLTTDYVHSLKETDSPEPKLPEVKQPQYKTKQSKVRTEHLTYPEKEPFVHVQDGGPIVKKAKIKLTR